MKLHLPRHLRHHLKIPTQILTQNVCPKKKKKSQKKSAIRTLPKQLQYDGKSNWLPFKHRFTKYAESSDWTAEECLDCLIWCLTGKAADFCATLMERTKHLSYRKLLKKLDERFGDRELPASAQVRFQQATQKKDESLEDWADRVLTLSGKAFKDLPEKYSNQQAVARFCQGLRDAEAGHHVCMKKSLSIEDALNEIRLYQHTKDAIYGHKTDRNVSSRVTAEDYDTDIPQVCAMADRKPKASQNSLEDKLEKLQENMAQLLRQQASLRRGPKNRLRPEDSICYLCNEKGNFRRDCPKQHQLDLNKPGTSQGAKARTQSKEGPQKN